MSRLVFVLLALMAPAAFSHDYTRGHLVIGHPWSRPTAAGVQTGVAYLSITNNGPTEEVLLGARSPAAARVELHQTIVSEGMARMRPLPRVVIAPGATVRIAPGGIHFMLFGLDAPLASGNEVPLILSFRGAGEIEVAIKVETRDAAAVVPTPTRGGHTTPNWPRGCRTSGHSLTTKTRTHTRGDATVRGAENISGGRRKLFPKWAT